MNRSQLERVIRASAAILGTDEFVVIDSQSILGAYPVAPAALTESVETNLYPLDEPAIHLAVSHG